MDLTHNLIAIHRDETNLEIQVIHMWKTCSTNIRYYLLRHFKHYKTMIMSDSVQNIEQHFARTSRCA